MLRRAQVDNLRTNHRGTFVLKDNTFRWLSTGRLRCAQVDNLRTNHRGTFVLKDNTFRWLAKLSVDPPPAPGAGAPAPVAGGSQLAPDYLVLPCALVRARGAGWLSWLSLRLLSSCHSSACPRARHVTWPARWCLHCANAVVTPLFTYKC